MFFLISLVFGVGLAIQAQEEKSKDTTALGIEKLKYKQQPGLALAASKIFFSDKPYSISGFGEFNYVPVRGDINPAAGDLELYYTGLYRYATFFGYRLTDKLIWNSEFQIELLHDGTNETQHEIVIEAFFDYLWKDYLKARIGFYPLTIGYVNNNDEPIMFYSVNRADVERLIIPSTWIEFGMMFYGSISDNWNYALGLSQGLNGQSFLSGTWVRQGRQINLSIPSSISINPQLNYTGIKNLTLSASGYYGNSTQGESYFDNAIEQSVNARIKLGSLYGKYDYKNLRIVAVGAFGELEDTPELFRLTSSENQMGQVLGSQVYGGLLEVGLDILPYFRKQKTVVEKEAWWYNTTEMKLNVFGRYERLNTHHRVAEEIQNLPRIENDLNIFTFGFNFKTKENIVFKLNYQYRKNNYSADPNPIRNIVETGIGFIF